MLLLVTRHSSLDTEMIPWPIALLSVCYGLVAAVSATLVWKVATGAAHQPLVWPVAWLALSGGIMCGLPLLKPWARRLAIVGSGLLMVVTLSVAGLLIINGRPLAGLLATIGASLHVIVIRYLNRPQVRVWFHMTPKLTERQ